MTPEPESSHPFVSVIIPVFNDAERLAACLDALDRQTYPAERWEAIVVDNGSTESPRGIVAKYPFAQFAEEAKPGSYAARNRGIALAKGEVLAFTDSDCIPQSSWLASGVKRLVEVPDCGFVGGAVEIFPLDPHRPTSVELFDMSFGLRQEENVERGFSVTANMFTRRSVFDRRGGFDTELKSGGDEEWGRRVSAAGEASCYAPRAVVRHPARRTYGAIIRQTRRHTGGRYDRHRNNPYRYRSLHFWRILWKSVFPNFGRMAEARRRLAAHGYGFAAWMRTCGVILAVQYARLFEFVRKFLGLSSERR